MERKLGFGLVALLCGLASSCVSPAQVDEDEPGNDGQEEASTSSTGAGSDQASAAEGSGGTRSESSTGSGPSGDASTGATGGTASGGTSTTGPGGSTSGQQTTAEEGSGDDICPFDGELQYDPGGAYPFCEGTEGVYLGVGEPLPGDPEPLQNRCREQVPGSLVGLGRIAWQSVDGSPDAEALQYCLCLDECESGSDCPAGDTGNAEPACITSGTQTSCFLTCDNGETCPGGMTCTQGHELEQRVCAWGTRDAGCDTSEWPNVTQPM